VTESGQVGGRYRVEHRGSDGVHVLGHVVGVFLHWTTLVPYASRLLREGATGCLILVDDATDEVVATYQLASGGRSHSVFGSRSRRPEPRNPGNRSDLSPQIGGVSIERSRSA